MPYSSQKIKDYIDKSPLKEFTDYTITQIDKGIFAAEVKIPSLFRRFDGIAHGGFISYLADSIMGFAALTLVDEHQTVFTANLNVSFLRPGLGDQMLGSATVMKQGVNVHFCEAEIFATRENGEHYLCAKASATMIVSNHKSI